MLVNSDVLIVGPTSRLGLRWPTAAACWRRRARRTRQWPAGRPYRASQQSPLYNKQPKVHISTVCMSRLSKKTSLRLTNDEQHGGRTTDGCANEHLAILGHRLTAIRQPEMHICRECKISLKMTFANYPNRLTRGRCRWAAGRGAAASWRSSCSTAHAPGRHRPLPPRRTSSFARRCRTRTPENKRHVSVKRKVWQNEMMIMVLERFVIFDSNMALTR